MIYLDYAATTPMSHEAIHVYTEVAKNIYGNTNSLHDVGSTAHSLLESCRIELGSLVNSKSDGIYFTSGGTESNHLVVQTLIQSFKGKGNHLITTSIEHSSLSNLFRKLEQEGFEVTYLPVDHTGKISLSDLKQSIKPTTILASIQHANSEIGVIQDLEAIGEILSRHSVLFHSDCVQTFGKIPIDVVKMNLDSISISSHKIYGPKGVGAAYINPNTNWIPLYPNTTHENGFRSGTVNVPGIASFVAAAQQIVSEMEENQRKVTMLREHLKNGINRYFEKIELIEHPNSQLQQIVGLRFHGIEGQYSMLEFNRHGLAVSTGSACAIGQQAPSKTILALGKTPEEAKQFIRLSFGKSTTIETIDKVISLCKQLTER
ncbi:IscS subfamily cysteine desulfurase [Litchfieldia salsa]|uniref:Cysteine desulfurase n=1 Tax=Litchfieldia salsa TaxID=930152 RepID=A0A1H0V5G8_9BACI|nr:IscS subfamily cysteine desulfurase [Litchfieldia salsa]SDP73356.1 cysteine desulfurase [Litchfieldia salsa]